MKKCKNSFLFFFAIAINIGFDFCPYLSAQSIQDSTLFYFKSIAEVKNVSNTSNALVFFENKAEQSLSKNDSIKAAYYLELVALGQFKMGALHDSEITSIKALGLLDAIKTNTNTQQPRERLYNHLGMLYRHIEDFNNALKYYNKALELNINLLDKISIITIIANVYANQDEYQKADLFLKNILERIVHKL